MPSNKNDKLQAQIMLSKHRVFPTIAMQWLITHDPESFELAANPFEAAFRVENLVNQREEIRKRWLGRVSTAPRAAGVCQNILSPPIQCSRN